MAPFVAGLELSRLFYEQAVRPVVAETFPRLPYSAARIGSGSEVLGYDTPRSADHEWGPRVQLFLNPEAIGLVGARLRNALSERLPRVFMGWPTNFGPAHAAIRRMEPTDGPVRHRIDVVTTATWCDAHLGFDPRRGISTLDWLATPAQRLAETVRGAVFHDGLDELNPLRERLSWYPSDVWRFLLLCQWQRIAQEEAFPGRCNEVGDELGCRVVTARLVRDLMRLSLLMDRRYAPYGKWLGSEFAASPSALDVDDPLRRALEAVGWRQREAGLAAAYRQLAEHHNALGLTERLDTSTRDYYDRPFQVIDAGRFAQALSKDLAGTALATLPRLGNVDQFADSTDLLTHPGRTRAITAAMYPDVATPQLAK